LVQNADGTFTVKVGRHRESCSADKTQLELFEWVKWTSISKGVRLEDVEIVELVQGAKGYS
jgi:hypothetical protein